jgi:hypothetical protein
MKKLMLLIIIAAAAAFAAKKFTDGQREQALWAEATDSIKQS